MSEPAVTVPQEEVQPSPPETPVETEPTAPSASAEPETQPDQPTAEPPKKGGVQRRIDELTRDKHLAEAEAEFWRKKALGEEPAKPAAATDKQPKAKPNPADYDGSEGRTMADYLEARDAWVREETLRAVDERLQKADQAREQKTEAEIITQEWAEKEAPILEKVADYKEVSAAAFDAVETALRTAISRNDNAARAALGALAHTIPLLDRGPEVTYYLGQHPEEIEALSKLHPTRVVAALGRIEARLVKDTEGAETTPQTRAPKPPTPIKKVAKADDGELRDDLPMDEWTRRFEKKRAERAKRG